MPKRTTLVILAIAGIFFLLFAFFLFRLFSSTEGSPFAGGERIGVVNISGPIMTANAYIEALHRFRKDKRIRAVVVRINTPGGAVGPSQEVYREVMKYSIGPKDKQKPILASMGSVAASGGYYIAAACPQIMANRGTMTGSIGVIAQIPNYEGILKWARIGMEVIKSGARKDIGSPYRTLGPEERKFMTELLGNVHEQFIRDVAKGRKLTLEKVRPVADGRVMTGEQAKKYGLVDRFGNLRDAIQWAATMAKVKGEPRVVYAPRRRTGLLDGLVRSAIRETVKSVKGASLVSKYKGPQLYYFWPTKGVLQ